MKCSAGGLSFDIYNTHIGLAQKKLLRMKKTSRDFKEQGKAVWVTRSRESKFEMHIFVCQY